MLTERAGPEVYLGEKPITDKVGGEKSRSLERALRTDRSDTCKRREEKREQELQTAAHLGKSVPGAWGYPKQRLPIRDQSQNVLALKPVVLWPWLGAALGSVASA